MGSTGTGRFTDYSESSGGRGPGAGGGSGGAGPQPATSGVNQCERAHGDISLEEVARCEYFKAHKAVPSVDTPVTVRAELVGRRLAVETVKDREVIGYLPTRYLYLWKCIKLGWKYSGQVLASSGSKSPLVRVDLAPDGRPKK